MEKEILYSVILPTYNRGVLLLEAIDSILVQDVPGEIEVIVVDDGSTDNTHALLASYGKKVKYFYQENVGPASARNLGISKALGKYIAFLDSDDIWKPGKIAAELLLFENYPNAELIVSDCESWLEGELHTASWFIDRKVLKNGETKFFDPDSHLWIRHKLLPTSCMTIRREVFSKLGWQPYDISLLSWEDWDLEIRLIRSCKILLSGQSLGVVRRWKDQTRFGRHVPGLAATNKQRIISLERKIKALEKVVAELDWSTKVNIELKKEIEISKEAYDKLINEKNFQDV